MATKSLENKARDKFIFLNNIIQLLKSKTKQIKPKAGIVSINT